MEFFQIPLEVQDDSEPKFILFRPLLGIAFIGNQKMADLTRQLLTYHAGQIKKSTSEIHSFLEKIGFLDPDPPTPSLPNQGEFSPTHVVLLLTNRCQMRCIYCYAAGGDLPPHDLSLKTAKKAIDIVFDNAAAQNQSFFTVSFHGGGEPTMAWDLLTECTAYARAKSLPVKISLTSNGVWSESQSKWILKHIDNISLSMDGHPAVQDRNRPFPNGAPSSQILKRTTQLLDANHKEYGIRMTAIEPWSDLPASVDYLFKTTQCKGIQVEPAFNTRRGEHTLPNSEQAQLFIEAFLDAYLISRQHQRSFRYSAARTGHPLRVFCTAPYNTLIVNPENEVVACYEITNPDHDLSDLSKYGHIDSSGLHLDQEKRKRLLALIDDYREKCRHCFCFWSCAGDCYARTISTMSDGTYQKMTTRCEINRALTRELLLHLISDGNGVAFLFRKAKKNE